VRTWYLSGKYPLKDGFSVNGAYEYEHSFETYQTVRLGCAMTSDNGMMKRTVIILLALAVLGIGLAVQAAHTEGGQDARIPSEAGLP